MTSLNFKRNIPPFSSHNENRLRKPSESPALSIKSPSIYTRDLDDPISKGKKNNKGIFSTNILEGKMNPLVLNIITNGQVNSLK